MNNPVPGNTKVGSDSRRFHGRIAVVTGGANAISGVNLPVDHGWLVANSWASFGGLRTS